MSCVERWRGRGERGRGEREMRGGKYENERMEV